MLEFWIYLFNFFCFLESLILIIIFRILLFMVINFFNVHFLLWFFFLFMEVITFIEICKAAFEGFPHFPISFYILLSFNLLLINLINFRLFGLDDLNVN